MRQITRSIVCAFESRTKLRIDNSRTDGTSLWLFGNKIAEWRGDGLWISNGGWSSRTTKERLNGLTGVHIVQRRDKWYLNEIEWDGRWVNVNMFSVGIDSVLEEIVQEPEFDLTSEWIRSEGYSKPIYAVFHSLNEASIVPVEDMLNGSGIPTRRMESDTEGVYRPNFFLVVRPEDVDSAVRILSESYCLA